MEFLKLSFFFVLLLLLFSGTSLNAQTVKLINVDQLEERVSRGGDTIYVVSFWATWCAPCIAELPSFEKLQETYKDQPLKVLLVSVDFKSKLERAVIPFVKNRKLKSEVFLLNEAKAQGYLDRISKDWSGAIPATLIYNKKNNTRNFYEKEFTYAELEKAYQSSK